MAKAKLKKGTKMYGRRGTVQFAITPHPAGHFEACVYFKGFTSKRENPRLEPLKCSTGRNPRLALARALQKFGKEYVAKRRGVFAGVK